jgi:transcriptional regulator with XRE-family HTH domain
MMSEPTLASPFAEHVARRIKILMATTGVYQSTVAEAVGMSLDQFSRRMSGRTEWSLADVLAVARYFEVPLSDIAPDHALPLPEKTEETTS